ncbi:related to Probable dipeptidyl-peptidase 5 [Lecanosticta acicola]|uniref:Dipeptidyl-peptidase V n=1 Tax=Lecanosticta acicola TaxID=111012 RepID=A0AAI8YSK1_9PEZI|nr:related to Probable dipeptidyl-peptidase 5 [Lecanosticta acicola]
MSLVSVLAAILPVVVQGLTPEGLITAPRYTNAIPNPSGEWAVFSSNNYSLDTHQNATTWRLMRLSTGAITDLPWDSNVTEVVWVGSTNTSVLYINGTNDHVPGGVTLWTADLADSAIRGTMVASLPAPYAGLKAAKTSTGSINFLLNSLAYANNGSAYNTALAATPLTTGRLYDGIYVRHWDTYLTPERYAVFSGSLTAGPDSSSYSFNGTMKNLLHGLSYSVTRPESPVGPYFDTGAGDYALSPDGSQVVFLTKAPQLPKANYTASYLYLVPHDGSSVAQALNGPDSTAPKTAQGASGAPEFSPNGKKLAYHQQDGISYESDRAKLYIADLETKEISLVAGNWDASVIKAKWSPDCNDLWISSGYIASDRLFIVPVDAGADFVPRNITGITSVSDYYILPDNQALVSANAVWASFLLYTTTASGASRYLYKSNEQDAELAGLGPEDVSFMWYTGTLGDSQQAIIVYPENFSPHKTYDLVFYIHGGPQGYTGNTWSPRWNLKTWADQGYVLVGPNPTGSTSYGQNLTDRIQGRWGSWPYEDLVLAHAHACHTLPYINCSNAVEAGASYGGYMTNWIQGHDLGREFKALVCHDGVTSTYNFYATDELWFIQHDFNGTLWDHRQTYAAWDPLSHAVNFSTPEFIVHSDLDYRLPVSEGITMFNVLQERGVPSRFLNFPDETHGVLDRENSLFWHREIFNWINYWTGKIDSLDNNAITM